MSAEEQKTSIIREEYKRKYHLRGNRNLTIKSADYNRLKGYYDEYKDISAQNYLPTVNFHDFILQYAELGYLNSRNKLKGK